MPRGKKRKTKTEPAEPVPAEIQAPFQPEASDKKMLASFMLVSVNIHLADKISKDGLSRFEDVEVAKAPSHLEGTYYTGFPVVTEALERQKLKSKNNIEQYYGPPLG